MPIERAAQHKRAGPIQLLGDVGGHACVGRGGRGEHRSTRRQLGEQATQAPIVGAEVVPPVGDAVGFVYHQHAGASGELGQNIVPEVADYSAAPG